MNGIVREGMTEMSFPFLITRFIFYHIAVLCWTYWVNFFNVAVTTGMSQPKTVQKYLGHATLQMTMDLYTSVMPKHLSNEIDKLDNELEKLSESGEEIIDSRYKQEKKNSIITFPGDSLVV